MRDLQFGVFVVFLSTLLSAGEVRVEYGQPRDLRDAQRLYIFAAGNEELDKETRRQVADALPMLAIVEQEVDSDLTLSVQRKSMPASEENEAGMVTAGRVARAHGKTLYLYLEETSRKEGLAEAVAEIVGPFVTLMQEANPRRFGVHRGDPRHVKPTINSTMGLHPGLSKQQVQEALGRPTRIDGKGGKNHIWTYVTTEGRMRLVFAGDRLAGVTFVENKR